MELLTKKYYRENFWTLLVLYIGLAQILDFYFPLNILGISFFITLFPYFLLLVKYIINNKYNSSLLILFLISLMILSLRSFFYNESFLEAIKKSFPFTVLFFIINYLLEKSNWMNLDSKLLEKVLVLILLIHFLNSILFFLDSSYAINNPDKSADNYVEIVGTRFSGIMGGPNVTGNFISIIFVFLVLFKRVTVIKYVVYFTIAFIAILPTMSRGPFLVLILVTAFKIFLSFCRSIFKPSVLIKSTLLILGVSLFIYKYIVPIFDDFIIRFFERFINSDFESRSSRIDFFIEKLNSNTLFYFIGIPWNLQTESSNFSISDNSFTLVASNFGVVYFIFYVFSYPFRRILWTNFNLKNSNLLIFSVIIVIVLFNNNSLLWTSWIFIAMLGFSYLRNFDNKCEKIKY